jgi:hypothetical protein
MRGGRRIEIPASFIVTRTTLSYEAAPGIGVTLQMSTIDIPATERINNEPAGSLLRRAEEQRPAVLRETRTTTAAAPAQRARRTITNRDLEAARRAREKSEEAYERRARELGLPSLEDARRRSEDESRRLGEQAHRSEEAEAQAEIYWRGRAAELRTEFAVLDAQINYLRNRLAQSSRPLTISSLGSFTLVTSLGARAPFGRRVPQPFIPRGTHTFGRTGAQAVGVVGFGGGSSRGQVLVNTASPVDLYGGQSAYPWQRGSVPVLLPFYGGYATDDASYERSVLATRLRELESVRAGLDARWRLLEDEARRAGAMPGWLRP